MTLMVTASDLQVCDVQHVATAKVAVMASRASSDEHYVIDLCDAVLSVKGLRQHRFPWLLGDPSPKTGRRVALPVDAYWPGFDLVVEFYERQHDEAVSFFDKPERLTVSGVHRGLQRALYDGRRRELVPEHGLKLVIITLDAFESRRGKIVRRPSDDRLAVVSLLEAVRS
ncbi:hypothetical protein [Georgenia sp. AZ-5]|uniref:hypothetical protein n=1 Tax=Georgenia sp. AZ-5 TaxID=3367526 RepID=UPI0037545F3A